MEAETHYAAAADASPQAAGGGGRAELLESCIDPELRAFIEEDRWASVFPVPTIPRPEAYRGSSSRLRARHGRRARSRALANHMLLGLSALNRGLPVGRTSGGRRPSEKELMVHRNVHASVLREASRFERARRGLSSGAPSRRPDVVDAESAPYMRLVKTDTKQIRIVADRIVEPGDEGEVDMLAALPV